MGKFLIPAILLLSGILVNGQDSTQTISRKEYDILMANRAAVQVERENLARIQNYRKRNAADNNPAATTSVSASQFTGKAKQYLKPDAAFQQKYAAFLASANTGITTLLPEKSCSEIGSKAKIKFDVLIGRCPFLFIPGAARFFSFRQADYVNYPLADIGIKDSLLYSPGSLNQGILVDLGDVGLESIALDSKGVDFLAKYNPAKTVEEAVRDAGQFETGVKADNFIYRSFVSFEKDKTYALRVIAYQPYSIVQDALKKTETKSYLIEKDVRKDAIIVFRVVEKSADGSVVLLWKELKSAPSPEILIPDAAPEK